MGIERLDDGEDPTPPPDATPPKAADRSGEVPSSTDIGRAEDHTPDSPPRESPEGVADKQAEPRTRDEYADHLAPPNSPPIDEQSPTEARNAYSDPGLEEGESDDALHVDDQARHGGGNELWMEVNDAPETGAPSTDSNDANFAGSNEDPTPHSDRPRPLTDAEWAGHLIEVREGLAQAEGKGLTPERMHTINGAGEIWTVERQLMHESILEKLYSEAADVPCDFKAIIAGGLGGAGKTTVLTERANIDLSQYLMINPDIFKAEMAGRGMIPEVEGLSPMEAADLVHEESSYLALQLALRAQSDGKNVIWDITMSTKKSTDGRIDDLRSAGYDEIDGLFVDIPVELSVERTESRHREGHELYRAGEGLGGRYVPPEVIQRQVDPGWGSKNRRTFEDLKGKFTHWSIYDNSIYREPARLIEAGSKRQGR